jgi:cation-transporting ATPase 13A3/4/5
VCIATLTVFSTWVLFGPTVSVALILDLVTLPWIGRMTIAIAVLINVGVSFAYEQWLHGPIAATVGVLWKASGRRRRRDGAIYEFVGHD